MLSIICREGKICSFSFSNCSLSPRKGVGSPAPTEDHMTTRTSYMPLFSERLNLCKPKVNSIKWEPNTTSLLNKGKHSGTKGKTESSQILYAVVCIWQKKKKKKACFMGETQLSSSLALIPLPIFTGQSSCLKASSRSTYDNRTQNSQM